MKKFSLSQTDSNQDQKAGSHLIRAEAPLITLMILTKITVFALDLDYVWLL